MLFPEASGSAQGGTDPEAPEGTVKAGPGSGSLPGRGAVGAGTRGAVQGRASHLPVIAGSAQFAVVPGRVVPAVLWFVEFPRRGKQRKRLEVELPDDSSARQASYHHTLRPRSLLFLVLKAGGKFSFLHF